MGTAAARWCELDKIDRPLLVGFAPLEPGDAAYHRDEIVLYWPFVGAGTWALDVHVASGGELEW